MIEGIDVSKWQKDIDWREVARSGIWFVFVKVSQATFQDPRFLEHWHGSKGYLLRGGYHFFQPGVDPVEQANFMLNTLQDTNDPGELPPVLDLERGPVTWQQVQAFMDTVEQALGRVPILYSSLGFLRPLGPPPKQWPLWIAHYTSAEQPTLPEGWDTWVFWQYTSQGRVPGYDKRIDRNRFNGSLRTLFLFAGMNLQEASWWRVGRLEQILLGVPGQEPSTGELYEVTAWALRIRGGPGVNYPKIGVLRRGQVVRVYRIVPGDSLGPWGRISPDQDKWICMRFTRKVT